MRIDFNQTLIAYDNEPMTDSDAVKDNGVPSNLTLKVVSVRALTALIRSEGGPNPSGDEKFMRGEMARKIHNSDGPVELTVDEAALIKRLVGIIYGPVVISAAWPILDGNQPMPAPRES